MTVIVDASVAIKWVIEEDGSDKARALVANESLAAPDLLFIECANVLWVKARRGLITSDKAKFAFAAIEATPIRAIPTRIYAAAAQVIALDLGQSAYDGLYLASALAETCLMITADEAFFRAASAHPIYRSGIKLLGTA